MHAGSRRARLTQFALSWCKQQGRSFRESPHANQQWQDARGYTHFQRPNAFSQQQGRSGIYVAAAALGLGSIFYVNSLQEVPYTHRRHAVWLSADMERALGKAAFEQIRSEAQQSGTLYPPNHPYVRRVKQIGQQIVRTALENKGGGYTKHLEGLDWEWVVVKRKDPNAMVVPGGKVVVHSGLLDIMRTDDELAAVLAHEIAHVIARHVAEKLSQAQLFELLRTIIFWTVGIPVPSGAVQLVVFLPNSRKLETEADIIGMQVAAQSCFNPAASITVFQKLGEAEKDSGVGTIPGWLRTHPVTGKRVKRVEEEVPEARQAYELSGCGVRRGALAGFWS